jgi:hypothetical protein
VNFIVFLSWFIDKCVCVVFFFFCSKFKLLSLFYVDSVFNVIYALKFKAFFKKIAEC